MPRGLNRITHGMRKTAEYRCWMGMRDRCNNKNSKYFKNYGARGIKLSPRWDKFENFFADMGKRPTGTFIERIDNEKGYSPDNCKWADRVEQNNNKRTNRLLIFRGETKTATQWGKIYGISYNTITERLARGWSVEKAITQKIDRKHLSKKAHHE